MLLPPDPEVVRSSVGTPGPRPILISGDHSFFCNDNATLAGESNLLGPVDALAGVVRVQWLQRYSGCNGVVETPTQNTRLHSCLRNRSLRVESCEALS